MAGIFGIQFYGGAPELEQHANRLLELAQQGFRHPCGIYQFTRSAIGSALPHFYSETNWPLKTRDGKHALAVFGEIYLASGAPVREYNFEESFLQPLLADPNAFLLTLDGSYCFAVMSDDECLLVNDPFGTFALHYCSLPSGFVFSSQMEGVRSTRSSHTLDEMGMLQTLGLGLCLAGRTLFDGVSRLPGASYLRVSQSGIILKKYFRPRYSESPEPVATMLGKIREELEHSVLLRTQYSNVLAPLTGGFDSRTTWSIILGKRFDVKAETHGLPDSTDIEIARRIAQTLHIPQKEILFDDGFIATLPDLWRKITRMSEGNLSIRYAPALKTLQMLSGQYPVLLDSFGGAFYRRQRMKVAERRIDPKRNIIPQIFRFEQSPLLASNLLRQEARHEMEACALNGLNEYYGSINETTLLGDKLDQYHLEEVGPMKDAPIGNMQMNFIGLGHPFLRLRAIELAATLPIAARRRDAVHKHIVHSSFPALERFAMDNVGFSTPYRGFSTLRYGKMVMEKVLGRLHTIFPYLRIRLRRPTIDLEHLLLPGVGYAEEILLAQHPQFDELVDRSSLEHVIEELKAGNVEQGNAVIQLISFRLFLDLFAAH